MEKEKPFDQDNRSKKKTNNLECMLLDKLNVSNKNNAAKQKTAQVEIWRGGGTERWRLTEIIRLVNDQFLSWKNSDFVYNYFVNVSLQR